MAREISAIADQIISDFEAAFGQVVPPLLRSFVRTLAKSIAAQSGQIELYADDASRENFPQTASENGLAEIWQTIINRPREQAGAASLVIRQTGSNGLVIQSGSLGPQYVGPNGTQYSVTTGGTIVGGYADITVTANIGGEIGNASTGAEFSMISALPGLDSPAIVQSVANYGTEQESLDDWRDAIIQLLSRPPTGGGPVDYYKTATSVTGIGDCFPYSGNVPGSVRLYPVASDQTDGLATPAELIAVRTAVEAAPWFPLWANSSLPDGSLRLQVLVSPITTYRVTISGLSPDTAAVRAAILANVTTYFAERKPFVTGLHNIDRSRVDNNELRAVVQNTYNQFGGGAFTSLAVAYESSPSSPAAYFTLPEGTRGKCNLVIS